jgi:hypothetical protein
MSNASIFFCTLTNFFFNEFSDLYNATLLFLANSLVSVSDCSLTLPSEYLELASFPFGDLDLGSRSIS